MYESLSARLGGPQTLKRLLCFLKQTINDTRVMGADSLEQIDTFIESSHAVHPDMRGHTGGAFTMGTVIIHGKGSKQKMNSKVQMKPR